MTEKEIWKVIPEFPNYYISNFGKIYNERAKIMMRPSFNNHGHLRITLTSDRGLRYTRSVPLLVAQAYVDAPNHRCDDVIILDGDFSNVRADNLAWRPASFAYKYTRQLKEQQPRHFENLPVLNIHERLEYDSIVHAGMYEGLLFEDIWASTKSGSPVYPTGAVFEVI